MFKSVISIKMKSIFNNKLAHYGDILAIPFFMISLYYFYLIKNKTLLEWLITLFIFICLVGDILFTFIFYRKKR